MSKPATFGPVLFSPDMVVQHRERLCAWVKANGVDPHDIPLTHPLRVERGKAGSVIRYQAYVRVGGKLLLDPDNEDQVLTEERTTPCTVPPPQLDTSSPPAQPEAGA